MINDINDRNQFYSVATPEEELKTFFMHKTSEDQEKAYEENFGNEKYNFPRNEVAKIKLYQNSFLNNKLYISGSETAKQNPGYMEGAIIAAKNIASQFS